MLREDMIQIVLSVGQEDIDRKSALKIMVFARIANNLATHEIDVRYYTITLILKMVVVGFVGCGIVWGVSSVQ